MESKDVVQQRDPPVEKESTQQIENGGKKRKQTDNDVPEMPKRKKSRDISQNEIVLSPELLKIAKHEVLKCADKIAESICKRIQSELGENCDEKHFEKETQRCLEAVLRCLDSNQFSNTILNENQKQVRFIVASSLPNEHFREIKQTQRNQLTELKAFHDGIPQMRRVEVDGNGNEVDNVMPETPDIVLQFLKPTTQSSSDEQSTGISNNEDQGEEDIDVPQNNNEKNIFSPPGSLKSAGMKLIGQGLYDGRNDSEIIPPENLKSQEDIIVEDVPVLERASIIDIFRGKKSVEDVHNIGENFYMSKIIEEEDSRNIGKNRTKSPELRPNKRRKLNNGNEKKLNTITENFANQNSSSENPDINSAQETERKELNYDIKPNFATLNSHLLQLAKNALERTRMKNFCDLSFLYTSNGTKKKNVPHQFSAEFKEWNKKHNEIMEKRRSKGFQEAQICKESFSAGKYKFDFFRNQYADCICKFCGSDEHLSYDCENKLEEEKDICYRCKVLGHKVENCNISKEDEIKSCTLCGKEDHFVSKCPKTVCNLCGNLGHWANKCGDPEKEIICFSCGGDHYEFKCPETKCWNCNNYGHWTKECPTFSNSKTFYSIRG